MNIQRIGLGVVAIGAVLLTAACGTGQQAGTSRERPTIDGQNADIGHIALRAISLAAPADGFFSVGDDVALSLVIANNGQDKADTLTSVSSTAFSSATQTSIKVAAGDAARIGIASGDETITLQGLTAAGAGADNGLFPGESVPVTFTFSNAGSVTTQVPVTLVFGGSRASVTAANSAE